MHKVLFFTFVGLICAYDLRTDLKDNCGIKIWRNNYYHYPTGTSYSLAFNEDTYRVKELSIKSGNQILLRTRFWPRNQREAQTVNANGMQSYLTYEFILLNETRVCFGANFDWECPGNVQEITCEPLPSWRSPVSSWCASSRPRDYSGNCIAAGDGASTECKELQVWNVFETVVTKPARVINGFRVNDCEGQVISEMTSDSITIREGQVDLQEPETKQQMIPVNNTNNFIQLMISVCPRTAVAINDLIAGLNEFMAGVNLSSSYIALTVFDGAYDSVDLLHFTNDADLINTAIANLTNYELRDDTCNVRQSIMKKFAETSAHIYGQPWDTVNFVIYSATGDLVNYVADDSAVTMPIGRRRDISTFVIGQNLPSSQDSLFYYLGARGLLKTTDSQSTIQAFKSVANSIMVSSSGFKLFGYCSPSRVGIIDAKILYKFENGNFLFPGSTLMELRYNATEFTPGCKAEHVRDFCSPCTTVIDNHHILCYDCFNQSYAALSRGTTYAQVLLRVPGNGSNWLQLPASGSSVRYNVYVRLGGLSNPLLYDIKVLAVSQSVELPELNTGDLVGVYVDWNNHSYNASLGIKIVSTDVTPPLASPVAPPVTPTPVAPIATPVSSPVVVPISSPVSAPMSSPVVVPISSPVSAPMSSPVVVPIASPVVAPVSAPIAVATPISEPGEAPVFGGPFGSPPVPVPLSPPVAAPTVVQEPVPVPVAEPVSAPVQPPVFEGSYVAAPSSQNQNDDSVSSGVRGLACFALLMGSLFLAF